MNTINIVTSSSSFIACGAGSTGKDVEGGSVLNLIATNESEESIESVKPQRLPFMIAMLLVNVIEDCLTALFLMSESSSNLRIQKTMAIMKTLKEARYSIEHVSITPDDVHYPLESTVNKIKKIFDDRQYLYDVLKETYMDLSLNSNFTALVQRTVKMDNYWDLVHRLYDEEATNKTRIKELRKQRRMQLNLHKSGEYDMLNRIQKLYNNITDNGQVNVYKLSFTDKWQSSREEQLAKTFENVESKNFRSIEEYKMKMEQEFSVHSEVEFYYNAVINETISEIENIMEKYDKDIEAIDLKLQIGKNKYSVVKEKRLALEEKIRKHARQIVEWTNFKEEREKAQLWTQTMHNSAIIVQAWWRGILKRHGFGPFRPKKSKKISAPASKKKKLASISLKIDLTV